MGWIFETLGDTLMLLSRDGVPFLAADPWLSGSACFGSWARERDLAPGSVKSVLRAPYVFRRAPPTAAPICRRSGRWAGAATPCCPKISIPACARV